MHLDGFVEYTLIFGVEGDAYDTLLARFYGAFGAFYRYATTRCCGACDEKGCCADVAELEEVGDCGVALTHCAEVVARLLKAYFGLAFIFCANYSQEG